MSRDDLKRAAAHAALEFVSPGTVIGVGTGSTTVFFIEGLSGLGVAGAVASSEDTARRLAEVEVPVVTLEQADGKLELYVDGADEVDPLLRLLKGAGGALAREKVLATAAEHFVCIVDDTKLVPVLGRMPVAVEVLPMAVSSVRRTLDALGGLSEQRPRYLTDNGNAILDVGGLDLSDPEALEIVLEALPGVVGCGIFARRRADAVLVGTADGVQAVTREH